MVRAPALWLPRLHVIAGDAVVGAPDFREQLAPVAAAGGSALALHLRTRTTSAARLFEVAAWLGGASQELGTLVVVNDRVDVAMAVGAGGVHLREDSLPPVAVREIAGDARFGGVRLVVGRSIHSPEQAAVLRGSGVDYLVLGSVYATGSHPGLRPLGPGAVAEAVKRAVVPVLAIGGIEPRVVAPLASLGAHGVVVMSGVWGAEDPPGAVTRYLQVLHTEDGE